MTSNEIGMILSLFGMAVTALSFQTEKKRAFLILQSVGNLFYLFSYVFNGGDIGIFINVIYVIRNLLFAFVLSEENKKHKGVGAISVGSALLITYGVFFMISPLTLAERLWNAVPIIGSLFGTVAVTQKNIDRVRLWKYGDSVSWLAYNLHIGTGALGGIIGEVINLASLTLGIIRRKKNK